MSKPIGRPPGLEFKSTRKRVISLKSAINPATGKQFTFREIGKQLNTSGANAFRFVQDLKNCCRDCCRPLKKIRTKTSKP